MITKKKTAAAKSLATASAKALTAVSSTASAAGKTAKVPAKKADDKVIAALELLNAKQVKTRRNKAKESNLKMRQHLWPEHDQSTLWLREDKTRKGYTTMPRTMPMFINLINDVSEQVTEGKSVPAGKSYLVLWCRVHDEGFLKIESEASAALEAGYEGERNVTTWREHMKVLKQLGFIDYKNGPAGPFQYILLLNPYQVVTALRLKGWVQESAYTALFQRAVDIGAMI